LAWALYSIGCAMLTSSCLREAVIVSSILRPGREKSGSASSEVTASHVYEVFASCDVRAS
jgi:hypothetical protein